MNRHAAKHSTPDLWALLDRIGRDRWPRLLRADKGFTSDPLMTGCEQRGLPFLLRLRMTKNVRRAIESLAHQHGYGVVRAFVGHGIGELFHMDPQVPHYYDARMRTMMRFID